MNAHVITIGDELLIGQVVNTNQSVIGGMLNSIGVHASRMTSVGDRMEDILEAFRSAWDSVPVVIVTGGLGPTHDDITKKAVCSFFDTDLVSDDGVRQHIRQLLEQRRQPWTAAAEEQTMVPRLATVFPNPIGTAPGIRVDRDGKHFFVLPGVPYEMKEMLGGSVIPFLGPFAGGSAIIHRTLKTTGIPESFLAQQLGDLDDLLRGATLAFLPAATGVRLRITAHAGAKSEAERMVVEAEHRIRAKISKYIYGMDDEELEDVVGRLLVERSLTIAVAESCTGGLIASRITDVSGSSAYFDRGVITYSDASKSELLGVPPALIDVNGAVSKEVAEAMASGVRRAAGTSIGLSTTGIAGPTGGSLTKPVGLVWIGFADASATFALKFNFSSGRLRVKERASQAALEIVRRRLLTIE